MQQSPHPHPHIQPTPNAESNYIDRMDFSQSRLEPIKIKKVLRLDSRDHPQIKTL